MARTTASPAKRSMLSKELVSDSSDSEDAQSSSSGATSSASNQSSSNTSSSKDGATSSSGDSSSDEENVQNQSPAEARTPSTTKSSLKPKGPPSVVGSIPSQPYEAPRGFHKINQNAFTASSPALKLLSNIGDKQVWHITAPASLPMSTLETFSIGAIGKDTTILSHQGRKYGIAKIKASSSECDCFLLPTSEGCFTQQPFNFSQNYQIYEMPRETDTEHITIDNIPTTATTVVPGKYAKPVRKQPPGLRMRYKPFGTDDGPGEGVSSDQSEPEAPRKKHKRHHKRNQGLEEPIVVDVDAPIIPVDSPSSQAPEETLTKKSKDKKSKKGHKDEKDRKKNRK